MNQKKTRFTSNIDPSLLFLAIAVLVGGYVRLAPVIQSAFPLNDGGMFYTMTKDLVANGYRLPLTISYNHLNLPFAYPPLAFYLAGLLADLTSWQIIDIIRIMPAVFSVFTIPAFYLLASVLIKNKYQLIFATLLFTFIPASFDWLIMGGGLTRSPAFFLSLLSLYFVYRLYTQNRVRDILLTAFFSSLTIYTHPEAAFHTAVSALVFFLFFGRNKRGIFKSLLVAGLALLATAPWWATVLIRHGFAPFLAAGETGFFNVTAFFQFFQFDLTDEYALKTIGALGLIGLFWYLSRRKVFFPIWLVVTFVSEPRSASLYLSPCIAMLASYSLTNILQLFNKPTILVDQENNDPHPLSGLVSKGLFLLLFGQWVISSIATINLVLTNSVLTISDKNAFDWINTNTAGESQFLVLTATSPLIDPVSEWFPALTGRKSIATSQGLEWDGSGSFEDILMESINVQKCMYLAYQCVDRWAEKNNKQFDFLYIHNPIKNESADEWSSFESALGDLSATSGHTELVYKNDEVAIYKVK